MAQRLRALVLAEDQGPTPNTHMVTHNHPYLQSKTQQEPYTHMIQRHISKTFSHIKHFLKKQIDR